MDIDDIFYIHTPKKVNHIGTSAKLQKTCLLNGHFPLPFLLESKSWPINTVGGIWAITTWYM